MSSSINAFAPNYAGAISVSPGTTTASTSCGQGSGVIVCTNLGSVVVYVKTGISTVTATTTTSYPILPLTQVSLSKSDQDTHVAYITASGTGSLHVMPGEGI